MGLLIGFLGGVFGGLVGLGGGTVMIPLMVGLLKLPQHRAHGTSLVAVFFTGLVGALTYGLQGSLDLKAALFLALTAILTALFGPLVPQKAILFVQSPLVVGESELYPDLALLKPRPDFYEEELPQGRDALLVVEVAESSLRYDLQVKLPLYAQAGVPEVWVVDLEGKRVLVHRKPEGGGYREAEALGPGARLSFHGVEIPAEELL